MRSTAVSAVDGQYLVAQLCHLLLVGASTLSRNSGSVLLGRTFTHHVPPSTVSPSRSEKVTSRPSKCSRTACVAAA